jgi:hypothetical protein
LPQSEQYRLVRATPWPPPAVVACRGYDNGDKECVAANGDNPATEDHGRPAVASAEVVDGLALTRFAYKRCGPADVSAATTAGRAAASVNRRMYR